MLLNGRRFAGRLQLITLFARRLPSSRQSSFGFLKQLKSLLQPPQS
jgi:hypothetical protein